VPEVAEPRFRSLSLEANDLTGLCVVSNQWLDDSSDHSDGEERLIKGFGQAVSWFTEVSFFNGTDVGMPEGMLIAPAAAGGSNTAILLQPPLTSRLAAIASARWRLTTRKGRRDNHERQQPASRL
jgi:HK97 family phage major capsid protein